MAAGATSPKPWTPSPAKPNAPTQAALPRRGPPAADVDGGVVVVGGGEVVVGVEYVVGGGASVVVVAAAAAADVVAEPSLVWGVHAVPFQCRIRIPGVPGSPGPAAFALAIVTGLSHPTAHASERDVAATPERAPTWDPRPGTGTLVHAEPFHSRITPFVGPSPEPLCPTAHALPVGRAATPERSILSCCDVESSPHVCRFHRSTRGVPGPHPQLLPSPTANTGRSGEASTPRRMLPRP